MTDAQVHHGSPGGGTRSSRPLAVVAILVALSTAACGGDDGPDAVAAEPPIGTELADGGPNATVELTAADFRFDDVPDTVPVGARFRLRNISSTEMHELIVIRIPDGDDRDVATLVALPEEELDELFGDEELLATVILALPGEDGFAVVGDGSVTEPGRYALLCFIPTGVDPDEFLAAVEAAGGGPPEIDSGPPHVAHGMFAEVVVTP